MLITTATVASPPRVDLTITVASSVSAQAASLVVTRDAGGQSWPVRGASDALAGGSAVVIDHEAPVGAAITYRAIAYSASGAQIDSGSVAVAALARPSDHSQWWLSDPLDQTSATLVSLLAGSDRDREYVSPSSWAQPLMSPYAVASLGTRQVSPVDLVINAEHGAESSRVRGLLSRALVLCVRHGCVDHQLPPVVYGAADTVSETYDHGIGLVRFALRLVPTRGTTLAPSVYAWTCQDVLDLGINSGALLTRYATCGDLLRGE